MDVPKDEYADYERLHELRTHLGSNIIDDCTLSRSNAIGSNRFYIRVHIEEAHRGKKT